MPPRHRFLEPIHNVKDRQRPSATWPAEAGYGVFISGVLVAARATSSPSPRLWRAAFCRRLGLSAEALAKAGGAYRDRTDDLKLAKLALSQLS